ncbi:hypothetical protein [Patulibacter defluvii]|uniref:hypothetical protein n=1 Tax=Patulibacter defluvii TaxID=3095358 RepID=UPI002A760664|nr:hypothetical protein [Patulibacter sp. DM4]
MLLVSLLSSAAIAFGLGANLPQIARMLQAGSAAGQSPFGWAMGAVANLCLAYVNLVGLGALLLGVANLITVLLCSVAIVLIRRLGAAPAEPLLHDARLDAMHTAELALTREAVEAAERRRADRRAAARAEEAPREDLVALPAA